MIKIILRGIFQNLLKYWTIRQWDDDSIAPSYYIEDCWISKLSLKSAVAELLNVTDKGSCQ